MSAVSGAGSAKEYKESLNGANFIRNAGNVQDSVVKSQATYVYETFSPTTGKWTRLPR